jgi:hypothetical protein
MDQWIKFSLEEENIIVDKRTSFSQKSETVVQVILTIAEYRQIFFSKSQINALQEVLQKKKPSVFWNFSEIDIIYTMASFRKINEWLEHDRFREAHKSNTNERTPVDREKEFIQHSEVVLRNVKLDLEAEKIYFSTNKIHM